MKKLALSLAFTLLLFNGCTKEVYIKPDLPTLHTWYVESGDLNITYEVFDENGKITL